MTKKASAFLSSWRNYKNPKPKQNQKSSKKNLHQKKKAQNKKKKFSLNQSRKKKKAFSQKQKSLSPPERYRKSNSLSFSVHWSAFFWKATLHLTLSTREKRI